MKFRLVEKIEKLDDYIYTTDSEYNLKDFILNNPEYYRIYYDFSIDRYFGCKAGRGTHNKLFKTALAQGFYGDNTEQLNKESVYTYSGLTTFISMPMDATYKDEADFCIEYDHYKIGAEWADKNLCIVFRDETPENIPFFKLLCEPSYYKDFSREN